MTDLRKRVANSQLKSKLAEAKYQSSGPRPEDDNKPPPWSGATWRQAQAAYASGWRPPVHKTPIILRPDGPVKDAKQLQDFLELRELLPTLQSHRRSYDDDDNDPDNPKGEPVQLSLLGAHEFGLLVDLIDGEYRSIWYKGKRRAAWESFSFKEGVDRESLQCWKFLKMDGLLRGQEGCREGQGETGKTEG